MKDSRPASWAPQTGPQKVLIDCPAPEILFGGARGGGKSDGILGKFGLKERRYGMAFNGVLFRREMPQADDLIERAKEIYLPCGAEWFEQKRMFLMPHGGRIRFRPLENVADAQKYQGQNLTDAAVEEAGNYPDSAPIDMLFGALRSKAGVPPQLLLTANPGGPGHLWLKMRYIDPAPRGLKQLRRKLPGGKMSHPYVFIPSRVTDNALLLANDPGYVDRLHLVGSPELVKAWVDGDWSVIAGAYFPEWSNEKHVVRPFTIPPYWMRFRSFDWGSAHPFSVQWWAVSDGTVPGVSKGALVQYREWYGMAEGQPNVGLRLTAEEVADGIKAREAGDSVRYGVADPSIFKQDGGPSIGERMVRRGVVFRAGDNSRVGHDGSMGGWDQVRARLKGDGKQPALVVFSTCVHFIRTFPALQHDPKHSEDVDSTGEDHAGDCARYACMSRPYVLVAPQKPKPRDAYAMDDWRQPEASGWAA